MAKRTGSYSMPTVHAARLLGLEIARARRARRWTAAELAERVGISTFTLRRVERGDPRVALGTMFEAATLVGVPLFNVSPSELGALVDLARDRLALLPNRVRDTADDVDDDF